MKQFFTNIMMLSLGFCMVVLMTSAISPKAAPVGTKTFTVVNKSEYAINNIYISHVDEDKWGEDLLGSNELLHPGESIEVEVDCDSYDVKLVDEDGITCELAAVNICAADTWVIGDLTECHQK